MDKIVIRSKAPLRIGLGGGGTDLSPYSDTYGGAILNASIGLFTYATIEVRNDERVSFHALERNEHWEQELRYPIPIDCTLPLHKGVYNRIIKDFCNEKPIALRLSTHSDAPAGSGLGTSSTLVVAMVDAFRELLSLPLSEYEVANIALRIERGDLGSAGGKQDQYAAAFGGVNYMEFYEHDKVIVNPLRVKSCTLNELNYNLLLYYTGKSRLSAAIIENQVANVNANNQNALHAMHNLKQQAVLMKEAILTQNLQEVGKLLDYGWCQKKMMAASISNPAIDEMYEDAKKAGAIGGKISGAGGGGFMMLYVDSKRRFEVCEVLAKHPGRFLDYQFYDHGVESWRVGPALGDCSGS
jgi:D-glycero-alpha-D-manno-heptose-7-phosphate kinase